MKRLTVKVTNSVFEVPDFSRISLDHSEIVCEPPQGNTEDMCKILYLENVLSKLN